MSKVLLINPSHRPARRKARKPASAAQRRARAAFAAMARSRRKNPAPRRRARRAAPRTHAVVHHRRRRNPIHALSRRRVHHRRRRNPISMGFSSRSIIAQLKAALIGGLGGVAMDMVMGQANKYLPAALKSDPNTVGVGDAVKAALTIGLGQLLRRTTRGASTRMAEGALTVQVADILRTLVPASMTVGYYSPLRVSNMQTRVGPNTASIAPGMARYMTPGRTQLLSRYMAPGSSQLLNGNGARSNSNVRMR